VGRDMRHLLGGEGKRKKEKKERKGKERKEVSIFIGKKGRYWTRGNIQERDHFTRYEVC
jgi:hypothetical protein